MQLKLNVDQEKFIYEIIRRYKPKPSLASMYNLNLTKLSSLICKNKLNKNRFFLFMQFFSGRSMPAPNLRSTFPCAWCHLKVK